MRVLHVIQELTVGGAERVMLSLARRGMEAGQPVAVAAAAGPLAAEVDCPVYPLPYVARRPSAVPVAAWALRGAVRDFRPDLVHCHNPGVALVAGIVTLRGRVRPALVSVHGVPEEDYPAAARTLRLAGLPAVACGPGVAEALREQDFAVRTTIPNGISPAPPPAADLAGLRQAWGIPTHGPLLVAVGRLVAQKDHATAVRALADLPGASLVVLGEGPLRAELAQLADRIGVADRLALPGARDDARAVVAAADVAVMSSRWEGLALSGLEALAAGTPLVATVARGVRETLHDGVDSLLVPVGDAPALARAVRAVLADPDLRRRLTAAGAVVAAAHSEGAMVNRYMALYEEVACRR
jgi:glycosyltransferase involved in cell wall biosynthesis